MLKILSNKRLLLYILLFGFVIRILINLIYQPPNFFDAQAYEKAGFELLNFFKIKKNIIMPLYSIVAYLNKICFNFYFFNIVFSTINIFLVSKITNKIFNDLFVSNLSAILMALYPFNIFYSITGFSETFFIMLLLTGFYFLFCKKFIISYIFFVLSVLCRPVGELIIPLILLYSFIFIHKLQKKKIIINLGLYIMVYVIFMSPWWYHNFLKYGKFVRLNLSTNYILYVGNNINNKSGGGVIIDDDDLRKFPERFKKEVRDYDFEIFRGKPGFETKVDYLDQEGNVNSYSIGFGVWQVDPGLGENLGKVSRKDGIDNFFLRDYYFKKAALDFIVKNPKLFLKNAFVKFKRFWSLIPHSYEFKNNTFFLIVSFLSVLFLLSFGLLGFFLDKNYRNLNLITFYLFIIYINLIHMILISSIRYRFIIEWILIILSSYSLSYIYKKFFS